MLLLLSSDSFTKLIFNTVHNNILAVVQKPVSIINILTKNNLQQLINFFLLLLIIAYRTKPAARKIVNLQQSLPYFCCYINIFSILIIDLQETG